MKLLIKDVSVNINGYYVRKSFVCGDFKIVVFCAFKAVDNAGRYNMVCKKSSLHYRDIY